MYINLDGFIHLRLELFNGKSVGVVHFISDLTEEGSSSSLFKKSRKDSKEVDRRKSMETAKEEFDRKERSEKRRESFDGYGTKKEEKREKEEKKERDEKKEKDEKREKGEEKPLSKNKSTVTAKWAEYIEQQKVSYLFLISILLHLVSNSII